MQAKERLNNAQRIAFDSLIDKMDAYFAYAKVNPDSDVGKELEKKYTQSERMFKAAVKIKDWL